jgi:hypothetical protein
MKADNKKMLETIISTIAKRQVEVSVLGGKNGKGVIISIVIDGSEAETSAAAKRIANMAGLKFTDGGYDSELEAYFCGINE